MSDEQACGDSVDPHVGDQSSNGGGLTPGDADIVTRQLGRTPRGAVKVAWRCPQGHPGVVMTRPRLSDGTPFPTLYYLTCPAIVKACSTLEADGLMASLTARLTDDVQFAAAYGQAHDSYLVDRETLAQELGIEVPEISGISAGGMPSRVKCLHTVVAHSLAKGPGVNPCGDEALEAIGVFCRSGCSQVCGPASEREVS